MDTQTGIQTICRYVKVIVVENERDTTVQNLEEAE